MKYALFILLLFVGVSAFAGKGGGRKRGLPRTEVGLMNNVIGCLSNKDSLSYFCLFVPFDTLWSLVLNNPDHSPQVVKEMDHLKGHPQSLLEFDPAYNRNIMERFRNVLSKGEDSGIHWTDIVMQRYELSREVNTHRELIGYDRIVPERFTGYLFVRDLLGRLTFCINITEIQKINGYFFGGQVLNILEASTIDEYMRKEREEKKDLHWLAKNKNNDSLKADSTKTDSPKAIKDPNKQDFLSMSVDEDTFKARREVVDRKYDQGKFDDEMPVQLFIRYMKDLRTGQVSAYDGVYRFGDRKKYIKLNITRTNDGKWLMEDVIPIGTMELELKDKTYTGSWTNNDLNGYDVEMKQAAISQRKLEALDKMLETGVFGKVDEDNVAVKKPEEKKPVKKDDDEELVKKKEEKKVMPIEDEPKPQRPKPKNDDEEEEDGSSKKKEEKKVMPVEDEPKAQRPKPRNEDDEEEDGTQQKPKPKNDEKAGRQQKGEDDTDNSGDMRKKERTRKRDRDEPKPKKQKPPRRYNDED